MTDYIRKNQKGTLFKNNRKESENQPDYNGNAKVGDVEYSLSAWINESAKGNKYLSISFTSEEELKAKGIGKQQEPVQNTIPDDDIPF
jgi:uncharacterized protein (DUF736 family)